MELSRQNQVQELQKFLGDNQGSGTNTIVCLSIAGSLDPSPKVLTPEEKKRQIQYKAQSSPILIEQQDAFDQQKMKVGGVRASTKLKNLMFSAQDIRQKFDNKKGRPFASVKETQERTDLARDLLSKDKEQKTLLLNLVPTNRDVSYKKEVVEPYQLGLIGGASSTIISHCKSQSSFIQSIQNKNSIIRTLEGNASPIIEHNQLRQTGSPLNIIQYGGGGGCKTSLTGSNTNKLDNYRQLPRTLESLKDIAVKISSKDNSSIIQQKQQSIATQSNQKQNKLIPQKFIKKIPDNFYIQNSSVLDLPNNESQLVKKQNQQLLNALSQLKEKQQQHKKKKEEMDHQIETVEQLKQGNKQIQQDMLLSFENLKLSSRVDTVALEEWMTNMLKEIQNKLNKSERKQELQEQAVSSQQKFELTQLVYNLTFIELSKQVSVQCNERGILLSQIWTAFLELIKEQLKIVTAEKNILERESIITVDRLYSYYEQILDDQRQSMLQMYKESMNYKRSYDRLLKDFEELKQKTALLGQRLSEVTVLYKQKYTKVDILEKTINNLQGVIQSLQEDDQDEDPTMNDNYFLEEQQKQDMKFEELYRRKEDGGIGQKSDEDNLNELMSPEIQIRLIDNVSKDLIGFLDNTEEKRNKEQAALEQADNFATEMMGEFFAHAQTDTDDFKEHLQNEGICVSQEIQLEKADLILYVNEELMMNEEIMLEDTGINLHNLKEQEYIDRIAQLEEMNRELEDELRRVNEQFDMKEAEANLYKGRVESLENTLDILKKEHIIQQQLVEEQQNQILKLNTDLTKANNKLEKQKDQIQQLQSENQNLNFQNARQSQMIGRASHLGGLEPASFASVKKRSAVSPLNSSDEDEDFAMNIEYVEDDKGKGGSVAVKKSKLPLTSFQLLVGKDKGKYKFAEFNLGYRPDRKKRLHPSQIAFLNFLKKKAIKNIMPKSQLLKTITSTYSDLQEFLRHQQKMPPLIPYLYDTMMHKYGIKKIGLQKFKQLLGSTVKLAGTNYRIALFGRLMRLVKPTYDANDIQTYIEVQKFLINLNIGVKIDNQDTDDFHLVPYVRAWEYMKINFENKIPIDEWTEMKKKVESLKKQDPRGMNKGGVIEMDEFIDQVLQEYHRLEILAAEKVYELFLATDFNNNGFMSADEFSVSYRNVVQQNLGKDYAYLLFQDYMEGVEDKENNCTLYGITFDNFLHLAMEFDILKVRDQNLFLSPLNLEKQFQEMIGQLQWQQAIWEQRLSKIGLLNDEWKENFYIFSKDIKDEVLSKRILLLRNKLIDEETKSLTYDYFFDQFMPKEFTNFIKIGVDEAYTQDYSERNQVTTEELMMKKLLAGIKEPKILLDNSLQEDASIAVGDENAGGAQQNDDSLTALDKKKKAKKKKKRIN